MNFISLISLYLEDYAWDPQFIDFCIEDICCDSSSLLEMFLNDPLLSTSDMGLPEQTLTTQGSIIYQKFGFLEIRF